MGARRFVDLPIRGLIELIMDWPLEGAANLKLIVQGRIVRRDATGTAVKMTRHEFLPQNLLPPQADPTGSAAAALFPTPPGSCKNMIEEWVANTGDARSDKGRRDWR